MLIIACALLAYKSTALPEPNPSFCAALSSPAVKCTKEQNSTPYYSYLCYNSFCHNNFIQICNCHGWRWALPLWMPRPVSQAQTSVQCSLSHSLSPLLFRLMPLHLHFPAIPELHLPLMMTTNGGRIWNALTLKRRQEWPHYSGCALHKCPSSKTEMLKSKTYYFIKTSIGRWYLVHWH